MCRAFSPLVSFALLAALLVGCRATAPSEVAPLLPAAGPLVLVKEVNLPEYEPWYTHFAVHTWIDYRDAEGAWRRVGVPGTSTDVVHISISAEVAFEDTRWGEPVRVIDRVTGARAARVVPELRTADEVWVEGSYEAFPGPNSNTFIERVVRRTDGLSTQLSPNAVGRDHAGLRAGVTSGGTGVELESAWLGVEVGLKEGVQLHLAQLPIGLRFWPPAVLLPFAPAIGMRY